MKGTAQICQSGVGDSSSLSDESPFNFGHHLRSLIKERGLSIREAAKRIGVAHPQLLRWLGKTHAPKQHTLERIARGLNLPVTLLLPTGHQNVSRKEFSLSNDWKKQIEVLEAKLKEYRKEREQLTNALVEINYLLNDSVKSGSDSGNLNATRLKITQTILELKKSNLFELY